MKANKCQHFAAKMNDICIKRTHMKWSMTK